MKGKKKIYWDACIFLAWLQNEPCKPGVMEGIEETVRQVHNNEVILFTSIMTQTEVLESKMSKAAGTKFENLFKRRNVLWVNHDPRVGRLSHDIRDYYAQRGINISQADSVHLASAILYEADEVHTLDGSGKRKRHADLLPLNGNVAGHKLKIMEPYVVQLSLAALLSSEEKQEEKPKRGKIDEGQAPNASTPEVSRGGIRPVKSQATEPAAEANPVTATTEASEPQAEHSEEE